ncbi:MAG: MBL fold metallo-hydrolase [Vicinamibacterales bacterium]
MTLQAGGIEVIDLMLLGKPKAVAAGLIRGPGGLAIVDPGPTSSLAGLRAGLTERGAAVADVDAILVTHVHLDHSGGVGVLVGENPEIAVYVHERGARHLADPRRLVESATKIYGEHMDRLWGTVLPVPDANLRRLAGGERFEAVPGRTIEAVYTPGHATHHVSYFDSASGILFAGDSAGVRAADCDYLLPPTPPPDIDVEAWSESIERMAALGPSWLFVTHFGLLDSAAERLLEFRERLLFFAGAVRDSFQAGESDAERIRRFRSVVGEDLRRHLSDEQAALYDSAMSLDTCWHGLARYWRNRA